MANEEVGNNLPDFLVFLHAGESKMLAVSQKNAPAHCRPRGGRSAKTHGEVQGVYVLGQGAHGDVINAGFGKFADGFKRDVAGHF